MSKNLILHSIALLFLISSAGCTSKKVENDEGAEISEMTGSGDESGDMGSGDLEASTSDESGGMADDDFGDSSSPDIAANDSPSDEFGEDKGASDNAGGGGELDSLGEEPKSGDDQMAGNGEETLQEPVTSEPEVGSEPTPETPVDSVASNSWDENQGLAEAEAPVEKKIIPLQKMITTPYMANKKPINAIYVAREGDTIDSVSQKIYGEDRTSELKKVNPTFKRRDMKVGDKVYYNSPQRPNDTATVLTYYEDMGLVPEVYLSQPGDNIRTVSKNLLGNENSWKEIWATNLDVESKGDLPESTRLRYWSSSPAAPIVADNSPTEPIASGTVGTPPPQMEEPVQFPDEPPPPVEAAPPPPPEPINAVPPPPPPVVNSVPPPKPMDKGMEGGLPMDENDQMWALGLGAILLIGLLLTIIVIKKKRARRSSGLDFQTATHTQID